MVNQQEHRISAVFRALSDPTRRGMVEQLARGPASIGDLGAPYGISKPAVSKHIRSLEEAGLLERRRDGRVHRCALKPEALRDAQVWIERSRRFWEASLTELARYLERVEPTEEEAP